MADINRSLYADIDALKEKIRSLEKLSSCPDMTDYPNLDALLYGNISGDWRDWSMLRTELYVFLREFKKTERRLRDRLALWEEDRDFWQCSKCLRYFHGIQEDAPFVEEDNPVCEKCHWTGRKTE